MLRISKLTDYAMMVLCFLALDPSKRVSVSLIAKATHLSPTTVAKILKTLLNSGFVSSTRGSAGGYQLAKQPTDLNVAEILTALEGGVAITNCCSPVKQCIFDQLCGVRDNWQVINRIILKAIEGITLQDMTGRLAAN
ncbi:MAG: SUF system Fe-S cluster assembly regulator [Gammaproteobacteria bacterium]|nr:SUF system Fe-S cluster assembly regulator [Gammaproteobacteria bacterium]